MATGTVGSFAYLRSGHLRERQTARIAVILLVTAIVGAPVGILLNSVVSGRALGVLLTGFVVVVAVLVWYRHSRTADDGLPPWHPIPALIAIGLLVATAGGMDSAGGPLLTVPLLVAIGAIDWRLAFTVGVPELCGVLIGWRVARAVPAGYPRWGMIIILIAIAPVLAFKH